MANFKKGDKVITTANKNFIGKGVEGVVVKPGGAFSGPQVAFENGKTKEFPGQHLAKI